MVLKVSFQSGRQVTYHRHAKKLHIHLAATKLSTRWAKRHPTSVRSTR
ncbi:hypothetical protein SAMN05444724_1043 [Salinivibrio sp. ES.052]|nr:hypothetical protein SAMN05444724_1043 [Salinivibrio sp. ES.052]